jgi:hypothetical protein
LGLSARARKKTQRYKKQNEKKTKKAHSNMEKEKFVKVKLKIFTLNNPAINETALFLLCQQHFFV